MIKVGFIGLGNMGGPMAANVLAGGFELTVYNRTASRAAAIEEQGARIASSVAELTRYADVVLACLADVAASHDVFLGDGGVVATARPGQVLVEGSWPLLRAGRLWAPRAGDPSTPPLQDP